jgi:predicted dehydrogenase
MRIGIVGCGKIATLHLPAVLSSPYVTSVAVTDCNQAQAEEVARRFGAGHVYPSYEAMLDRNRPDVVHVLTPPATHAELAMQAMDQGCHVLVEKPMALFDEDARAMSECARRNAVRLCVNHNLLCQPLMAKLQRLVDRGALGELLHVEAHFAFDISRSQLAEPGKAMDGPRAEGTRAAWMAQLQGGPLFDFVPHPVSLLAHFLEGPLRVHAVARERGRLGTGFPDELRAMVDGPDATGALFLSMGTRPDCVTVTLYGSQRTVEVNLSNMTLVTRRLRRVPKALGRGLDSLEQATQLVAGTVAGSVGVLSRLKKPPGAVDMLIHGFYRSLVDGAPPPVTPAEGEAVVRLTSEIRRQVSPPVPERIRALVPRRETERRQAV